MATLPEGLGRPLRRKLAAMRAKLLRVEVLRRLAFVIAVPIIAMAILLACDWLTDLSMAARMASLTAIAFVTLGLLGWTLAALWTSRQDDESLALLIERKRGGLRSRLISSVQFAEGKTSVAEGAPRAMVEKLVADTEELTRPDSFSDIVNTVPLKRAMAVLLLVGLIAAAGYLGGGSLTLALLQRAFLSDIPVPRATRVVWTTGDLKVGRGDDLVLQARVEGDLPAQGTLGMRFESGRRQRVSMPPANGGEGLYAATLQNLQESFSYVAAVNDGRSARRQVRVLPRPAVVALSGRQTYEDYTKLPPSVHKPGEFLLFPGSELELTIQSTQPLRDGALRLLGTDTVLSATVDGADPSIMRAAFKVPDGDLTGFTVRLLDTEGMASQDATVYRVDILNDEPPTVKIVHPSRQRELVTAKACVLLAFEAEDRFGVDRLALMYAVGESEPQALAIPIDEAGAKQVAGRFDWDLEQISPALTIGDEVTFWLEAHDENAGTAAGQSTPRYLQVVTAREKREDLLSRAGDTLGRIDEATDSQERINAALAAWIRARAPGLSSPPEEPKDNEDDED